MRCLYAIVIIHSATDTLLKRLFHGTMKLKVNYLLRNLQLAKEHILAIASSIYQALALLEGWLF